ncbi:MAG: undecaprenyldiphospho-muramoylpentapeptide beta-N-acetylglucosaminyltransferase [Aerococcus sp.]|nr:undecaprenyldiphospho-muramoylpentapeptide beta-N-acetylglucosaminyltransferase [Aerococcus sp.]
MRIIFSGGGTGGHIYPSLALIREIKRQYPESEILYIGTTRGLESKIVPKAGIPFQAVDIQGLRRSLSLENFRTMWLFWTSIRRSRQIIRSFQPDVVIGTGGYVCAPVLYAAAKLGIPTIIHEQNSIAGLTNKFLARYVNKIAISFATVKKDFQKFTDKVVYTGNPRAQEVATIDQKADLEQYGLQNNQPTVLVFGGSRGAEKINQTIFSVREQLEQEDFQTLIVTGDIYYDEMTQAHPEIANYQRVKLTPYIDHMPEVLNAVSLVVSRSGATTLTELTALGKPSILIPSPNVTHNHQQFNAETLAHEDAAVMILERDLSPENLLQTLELLMQDAEQRQQMSKRAQKMGVPDAGDRMIQLIQSLVK